MFTSRMHWRQHYAEGPNGRRQERRLFPSHHCSLVFLLAAPALFLCKSWAVGCLLVDEVALKLTVVLNLGRNGSCFNLAYGFLHTSMMHVDSLSFPKPLKPPRFGQAQGANRRDNSDINFSPLPVYHHHCKMLAPLVLTLRKTPALIRHSGVVIGCLILPDRS
jgi:hypothetical protein